MKRKKRKTAGASVSYQNKDITAKALAEHFKGKSFEAFGLSYLPKVVGILPTNLPVIEANELKIDNVFVLEDGSWAIVDYESVYRKRNLAKYLGYVARLVRRMYNLHNRFFKIRIIIIYTADVRRGTTEPVMDCGAFRMEIEEAFLSELDSEEIYDRIRSKLEKGESLDDKDLMQLIIYPLTYKGKESKQEAVGRAVDLAEKLKAGQDTKMFVYAAIATFADKVICDDDRERIRRLIEMTRLGRELAEDYVKMGIKEGKEQGKKQGLRQGEKRGREKEKLRIAQKLFREGVSAETIAKCSGLPTEKLQEIQGKLMQPA